MPCDQVTHKAQSGAGCCPSPSQHPPPLAMSTLRPSHQRGPRTRLSGKKSQPWWSTSTPPSPTMSSNASHTCGARSSMAANVVVIGIPHPHPPLYWGAPRKAEQRPPAETACRLAAEGANGPSRLDPTARALPCTHRKRMHLICTHMTPTAPRRRPTLTHPREAVSATSAPETTHTHTLTPTHACTHLVLVQYVGLELLVPSRVQALGLDQVANVDVAVARLTGHPLAQRGLARPRRPCHEDVGSPPHPINGGGCRAEGPVPVSEHGETLWCGVAAGVEEVEQCEPGA